MKYKSISISNYFELVKPQYVFFKLTPHSSCRNNSSDKLAQLVNKLYIDFTKRIYKEEKKLFFRTDTKVSYYIYLEKHKAEFYFIVPVPYKRLFKEKISDTWRNIEIKEVKELPQFSKDCTKYGLRYKKEDALSLAVDKRDNDLLSSTLNIMEILESDTNDKIGIIYNFIPSSPTILNSFREYHREIIEKYKKHIPLDKDKKNIWYILKMALNFLINTVDGLLEATQQGLKQTIQNNITIVQNRELSRATYKKENSTLCRSQIVVLSESNNRNNQEINARAIAESFAVIDEDNSLTYDEMKKDFNILDTTFPSKILDTSTQECQNFLQMPGRELLKQFNDIDHLKVLENPVPKELQEGFFRLGNVKVKETNTKAYKSNDSQLSRLGMAYLGSMGAGKTTFMTNNAKDIINAGYGLVNIDIVNNCELSEAIKAITPKDRLVEIDCSNPNQLQAFAFNEIEINDSMSDYEKVSNATLHTQQIAVLLDAINDDNSKLTPRMLRYLYAAATVVFFNNSNASFKNVIDVLLDPAKRNDLINSLSVEAKEILIDEIDDLKELTKKDKKGNMENADTKIDGIIDRISWLKTNFYTKLAFTKDSKDNIDFVEAINQNKVILIKIPEKIFNSKMIRNVLATFYLSKIWLSKQLGATESKTELFINEIHQSYNCQLLMEDILVECRKFNLVPTLALHYLGQCTNKLKNSILASGSSFLLISGCDVKAFTELRPHFEKYGYSEADLVELERYNALCLIKNEESNYSAFVTRLPA